MNLILVAVLDVVALTAAVLFFVGVPLVVGLVAFDVIDSRRRAAEANDAPEVLTIKELHRVARHAPSGRLTA